MRCSLTICTNANVALNAASTLVLSRKPSWAALVVVYLVFVLAPSGSRPARHPGLGLTIIGPRPQEAAHSHARTHAQPRQLPLPRVNLADTPRHAQDPSHPHTVRTTAQTCQATSAASGPGSLTSLRPLAWVRRGWRSVVVRLGHFLHHEIGRAREAGDSRKRLVKQPRHPV